MNRKFFYLLHAHLILAAIMMSNCNEMGAEMDKKPTTLNDGSRCVYSSYQGSAEIVRIKQTPASLEQSKVLGGPRYEGYEVWFLFRPQTNYSLGKHTSKINREHLLMLNNGWYVGSRYLKKYGIKAGNIIPCTMKIIKEGTCTPIVFEFKTIDRNDYFETRP